MPRRRAVLLGGAAMLAGAAPEETGIAPDLSERFAAAREAGLLPNVHGVVAMRGGRIVLEQYLAGFDARRARPLGLVRFGPETPHDLRSVTKSIVGLLYGIALAAGRVPEPDAPLMAQFPDYPDLAADPDRARWRIGHVLSMTLGTEWEEIAIPYGDPRNSETAMDAAPDRYRFILERPVRRPPGEAWTYNGGATALLGLLIARGTGRDLEEFAREALFAPLGITGAEWDRDARGQPIAASGLRMTPRELARIGVMVLAQGRWEGRQVVPAEWIAASLRPAVAMPDGRRYGYHWYLGAVARDDGSGGVRREPVVSAIGYGGQRLFLLPGLDLVVAVTAGNYEAPDQWRPPLAVLRDVILPTLRG